jgi:hypothetical protein
MRTKTVKITANNYFVAQDDLSMTIEEIMKKYDAEYIYIEKIKYIPSESDLKKTLEHFIKEKGVSKIQVREYGMYHTCSRCKTIDASRFSNPLSVHCRRCHAEYMADRRRKEKNGEITPKKIEKRKSFAEVVAELSSLRIQVKEMKDSLDEILTVLS